MSNQRSPRRSPAEILAAKQAELAKLAVRAAKESQHPAITRLQAVLADLNGEIVQHQRGFSKGPQSFASRIAAHDRWIVEITRARDLASTALKCIQARKEIIQAEIQAIAREIAEKPDTNISEDYLAEVVRIAFQPSPSLVSATDDYNRAVAARKNLQQENEAGA